MGLSKSLAWTDFGAKKGSVGQLGSFPGNVLSACLLAGAEVTGS